MTTTATGWTRFAGANIKGTPSMSAAKVAQDLEVLRANASVLVLQEFRWRWYWSTLRATLVRDRWGTAPGVAMGLARSTFSAQAVAWRRKDWRRKATRQRKLHDGMARVSEARQLRAALLENRGTSLAAWFGTTHFVVGGDRDDDGRQVSGYRTRRMILAHDMQLLGAFLRELKATGYPVVFQADLNIKPNTWAYKELRFLLKSVGARIIGDHGVEYLILIDGTTVAVEVENDWTIGPRRLNTDHEVRGITFRLARMF